MNKHFKILIYTLLITSILSGCKSKEKLAKDAGIVVGKSLVNNIIMAEPAFETIEFKRMQIAINLNNKQRYKSNASAKIIRDSVIQISIHPFLGIEIFSVRITPDFIWVLDKTKGVYYQSDYQLFQKELGIGIDYKALEAVFTNQLFALDNQKQFDKVFKKTSDKTISTNYQALSHDVMVDDSFRIKEVSLVSYPAMEEFKVDYADFVENLELIFPSEIKFKFHSLREIYTFDLSVSRMAINEDIRVQEPNYQQYKKADVSSLLKK